MPRRLSGGFTLEQVRTIQEKTKQRIPELDEPEKPGKKPRASPSPPKQKAPRRPRSTEELPQVTPRGSGTVAVISFPFLPLSWNQQVSKGCQQEKMSRAMEQKRSALKALKDVEDILPVFTVPVTLSYTVHRPDAARCDRDNVCTKYITDALVHARVIPDDSSRWVKGHWPDLVVGSPPRTVLRIEPQQNPKEEVCSTPPPQRQSPLATTPQRSRMFRDKRRRRE